LARSFFTFFTSFVTLLLRALFANGKIIYLALVSVLNTSGKKF